MQPTKVFYFLCLALLLGLWGCKPPTNIEPPTWDSDVVLPVLYTDLNINSLKELDLLTYKRDVSDFVLNLQNGNIPGFTRDSVGLLEIAENDTTLDLYYGYVVKGKIKFVIDNTFPLTFLQGATLKFWNTENQLISTYTLPRDIPANTKLDTLGPILIENKKVTNPIYLSVHNLKSNGANGAVVTGKRLQVKTLFYRDSLEEVFFRPTSIYKANDTTAFTLDELDQDQITGKFRVKVVNEFPVAYRFQCYLLDGTKTTIIDSLFSAGPFETSGAETNPQTGALIKATERVDTINLTTDRINKLKQAQFIVLKGRNLVKDVDYLVKKDHDLSLRIGFDGTIKVKLKDN